MFFATMSTSTLLDTVEDTIHHDILKPSFGENNNLLERRIEMIVGVSGGCDSVALLHILETLRRKSKNNWDLRVVHFDHQQRDIESDKDRLLTEQLCNRYELPFDCFYWGNKTSSSSSVISSDVGSSFSQDSARQWRRAHMKDLATKNNSNNSQSKISPPPHTFLVTAHHKDDSEETLLLKLLRGVHLSNLSGLSAVTIEEEKHGAEATGPIIQRTAPLFLGLVL